MEKRPAALNTFAEVAGIKKRVQSLHRIPGALLLRVEETETGGVRKIDRGNEVGALLQLGDHARFPGKRAQLPDDLRVLENDPPSFRRRWGVGLCQREDLVPVSRGLDDLQIVVVNVAGG